MKLSEIIKNARLEADLTQADVGVALGYNGIQSQPALSRWENEKTNVGFRNFKKLIEILPIRGKWISSNEWEDETGEVHTFKEHGPKKSPTVRNKQAFDRQEILTRYAESARQIYNGRTAGDFTWEGLLSSFYNEFV